MISRADQDRLNIDPHIGRPHSPASNTYNLLLPSPILLWHILIPLAVIQYNPPLPLLSLPSYMSACLNHRARPPMYFNSFTCSFITLRNDFEYLLCYAAPWKSTVLFKNSSGYVNKYHASDSTTQRWGYKGFTYTFHGPTCSSPFWWPFDFSNWNTRQSLFTLIWVILQSTQFSARFINF